MKRRTAKRLGVLILSFLCAVTAVPAAAETEAPAEEVIVVPDAAQPAEEIAAGESAQPAENIAAEESAQPAEEIAAAESAQPAEEIAASESAQPAEENAAAEAAQDAEEAEDTLAEEELETAADAVPSVEYRTHVQTYGWQDYVKDGDMSGTSGESKRLEGIKIKIAGRDDLGVEYRTHVQTYGWQEYVGNDAVAGTTGESKRLEAIQIRLTGAAAAEYDVYYCVHVQSYGWLNWAKNDQMAGSAGYSKRLEGIRIRILPKGSPAPVSESGAVSPFISSDGTGEPGANTYQVVYNTHVQTYGWQDWVGDGALGGTSGESKRLEGMHVLLQNPEAEGSIEYRTHVQSIGWQEWVKDGALAGTTGQGKRLEALQIRLTGTMAEKYDVWYRTHCQNFGWMGWAKNGEESGTQGYGYRMEAMEIKLLPKGSEAPGSTDTPFVAGRRIGGRIVYEKSASKGKMIVLDPGHAMHIPAGSEPNAPGSGAMKAKDTYGTFGYASQLPEYVLCLQVAVKLKNELVDRGYSVVLTRETNDTAMSCIERTQVANEANADAYIRIHGNGGGGPGVITMCTTDKNPNTKDTYAQSSRLSEILLDTYCAVTGRRKIGVAYTDDLTGNNWAKVPTTLIELGFMTVPEEDLWMASASGQASIVKGMADGLDKYFS